MALEDLPELSPTSRAETAIISLSRIQVGCDSLTTAASSLTTAAVSYSQSDTQTIIDRVASLEAAIRPV